MKKIIAFLAVLVLATSVFAAGQADVSAMEKIKTNGKIILGTSADYPPYEFHALIDGKDTIVGFDISIAQEIAKDLKPSARGEYEITDINREYLIRKQLKMKKINIGNAWLDSGTFESLNDASNFVRMVEERTGIKVNDLESLK